MARIRTVKPDFFRHEGLFDLERESGLPVRLGFAGLWTCCDREGRFKWRPRELKTQIIPYDDVDFSRVLDALSTRGFVLRYEIAGQVYGVVPTWNRHQVINNRERPSELPAPPDPISLQSLDACAMRASREDDASITRGRNGKEEGKGRERNGNGKEKDVCSELSKLTSEPMPAAPVIALPLNDGRERGVTQADVCECKKLYPAVDVLQELRNMRGWLVSHPRNRKTGAGILRFMHGWLKREQDRAPVREEPIAEPRVAQTDPIPLGFNYRPTWTK